MNRTLSYRSNLELDGVSVHSPGRMVRGKKSDCQGNVAWYVPGARRYSSVCTVENLGLKYYMYL
jgi:hypothetical protein